MGETYCSGTYIYQGLNTATLEITDVGMGIVELGDSGMGVVVGNTMTITAFNASELNGLFTKKSGSGDDDVTLEGIAFADDNISLTEGATRILQVVAIPSDATLPQCHFSSDDTGVATVNTTGKVTAVAKGTATITATTSDGKFTANCYVTVVSGGSEELYQEPYLGFGASMETVKWNETRQLAAEEEDYLAFWGENDDVYSVEYEFDYDAMYISYVGFNNTSNIEQRVLNFLNGKYEYLGESDGIKYFTSSDETVHILFFEDDGYFFAAYVDPSYDGKSSHPTKHSKVAIPFR
jgi:hypothetical protein